MKLADLFQSNPLPSARVLDHVLPPDPQPPSRPTVPPPTCGTLPPALPVLEALGKQLGRFAR